MISPDYFIFDGKSSLDFGLWMFGSKALPAPKADITELTIPGRNGVLHQYNGRYDDTRVDYSVVVPGTGNEWNRTAAYQRISDFLGYLTSKHGYKRLEDTLRPNEYRMAMYEGGTKPIMSLRDDLGGAEIEFSCRPERWLKSGEIEIAVSNGIVIWNPTYNIAKPLITAYGTGTLTIGSVTIQITAANSYTTIDCELQEAYKETVNCNGNLELLNGEFPVLQPGENEITFTGFSSIKLCPRWYIL